MERLEISNESEALSKNWIVVPVARIVKADWNYKGDNEALKEKLKANIKRNGQVENVLVRELDTGFFEMVNGNHRYDAVRELGIETIVAYNLGPITQAQAMRIAIETNETRFATDTVKLSERIAELSKEFSFEDMASTMAFDSEQLESMTKMLDFNWDEFADDKSSNNEPQKEESVLKVKVTQHTLERWNTLLEVYHKLVEEDTDDAIMDFAIGRALFELEQSYGKQD